MKRKLCACGRSIYGIGSLCVTCLEARRAMRADRPAKVLRIELPDAGRHPAHLAWIRLQPCAVADCPGKSQAAHVRMNSGGGMGLKPDDRWCIPLCGPGQHFGHHAEQHRIGHAAFDLKYGIDSRALAERLASESPYLETEDSTGPTTDHR